MFELELLNVRDWAAGVEVFGADRVDDDDDDVLRRELELAAERRERGDAREETVEEKALLDDMEEDLLDDVVPDDKEPELQTYWPTGRGIDGETPERWLWRETPERMEVDIGLPRAAPSAKSMKVEFGSQKLSVSLEDDVVVARTLEGPVIASECTWALSEDRTCLEVILAKRIDDQEAVWARPFKLVDVDDGVSVPTVVCAIGWQSRWPRATLRRHLGLSAHRSAIATILNRRDLYRKPAPMAPRPTRPTFWPAT